MEQENPGMPRDDDTQQPSLPPGAPRYKSHKIVRALQITEVQQDPMDLASVNVRLGDHPEAVNLTGGILARYTPRVGDYLVEYEGDGYVSISPQQAFEDGYSLVED